MTLRDAYFWVQKLAAVALILQNLELFWVEAWPWAIVRKDFLEFPRAGIRIADFVFHERGAGRFKILILFAAVFYLFLPNPGLSLFLFVATLLTAWRWRGNFNGGSDFMTLIWLLCLTIGGFSSSETVQKGALLYLALQAVSSYLISGIAKAKSPAWRGGQALIGFQNLAIYSKLNWAAWLLRHRAAALLSSWIIIVFECLFPLSVLASTWSLAFIGFAVLFHGLNWLFFGLNRFLWAWLPSYPALYFASLWIQSHH